MAEEGSVSFVPVTLTPAVAYDVVIIGGGPAGASAALYNARAKLNTLVLDKSITAGALGMTHKIANYPGVPEVLSGEELVQRMRQQAEHFGAEFRKERVLKTTLSAAPKQIVTADGHTYSARAVILAAGAMGRTKTVPGEEDFLGRGVSYCATCDAAFFQDQDVLVIGNSEEAAEEALLLTKFAKRVDLVYPQAESKAATEVQAQLLATGRVSLLPQHRLQRIEGNGVVTTAILRNPEGQDEPRAVGGVFIYSQGNKPIIDYLDGAVATTTEGCIVVDHEMATHTPGVFAAGDLLCTVVKQAVVASAEGVVAALSAEKYLNHRKRVLRDYN